ncbi:hypothetical protein B0H21DRAFT_824871 [Amylocystis lapponica]|nr:hypothetical protein B0H21DRAFT_824871 [Amylocystis lapponica]
MSDTSDHVHAYGHCPFAAALSPDSPPNPHVYCAPKDGDSRSPCPALNTLANHGYLPRDGNCITPRVILHALRDAYHLSWPLAWLLTYGGFYLLGQRRKRICLADLARHNCIEHDASLVHPDVLHRGEYAPTSVSRDMLHRFLAHSADGAVMTPEDVARARVAREAGYPKPMDKLHAEIARGEMAIALHLFSSPAAPPPRPPLLARLKHALAPKTAPVATDADAPQPGIPLQHLHEWMHDERLPDGWAPSHTLSLRKTVRMAATLRAAMRRLAREGVAPAPLAIVTEAPAECGDACAVVEGERTAAESESARTPSVLGSPTSVDFPSAVSSPVPETPPDSPWSRKGRAGEKVPMVYVAEARKVASSEMGEESLLDVMPALAMVSTLMANITASTAPNVPLASNAQLDGFGAGHVFGFNTDFDFDFTLNASEGFDVTFNTGIGFDSINANMGFDSNLDADNSANNFDFGMFQNNIILEAPRNTALVPICDAGVDSGAEISNEIFMQTFVGMLNSNTHDASNIRPDSPEVVTVAVAPVAQIGQLVRTSPTSATDGTNVAKPPSQLVESTEGSCGDKRKAPTEAPDSEETVRKRMLLEESSEEMEDGWRDEDNGYIEDDTKRSKDYGRRVKQSLKAARLMDKRDRPYAFIYFSRPESILARNGKAKLFISSMMEAALAGSRKVMDMVDNAVRHHAQSSTMTYEEVKALNMKVSDAQAVTERERACRRQLELEVARLQQQVQGNNEN